MGIIQNAIDRVFGNLAPPTFEETLSAASMIDPSSGVPYAVAPPPDPSFSSLRDLQDRQLKQRAGDDNQSLRVLVLNVSQTGLIFDAAVDANAFALLPRGYDVSGNTIESSDTARISVEFNNSGLYVPFSFNVIQQGVQKGDLVSFSGKITWMRVRCEIPTQDTNQNNMICALAKDISMLAPYGGISLYSRPSAAAGNPQASVQAQVSSGSPATADAAPTSSSSPTVIPSGGGGGGGGTGGSGGRSRLS